MITSDIISKWSLRFASRGQTPPVLDSREKLTAVATNTNSIMNSAAIETQRVLLVDEYHAMHGYINGLTDVMDAASKEIEGLIRIVKPNNALVIHGLCVTNMAISLIEDVHVLNNLTSAMLSLPSSSYNANNVETIMYDRFFEGEDSYDMIIGYLGMCAYLPNVLQKIIERVKSKGVLVLHNASDLGASYQSEASVGNAAMSEIVDSGLFDVYHYASTVSFALCIKK